MYQDSVNLGQYRFYSFSLLDSKKVKNVTFRLNSLHGDADIYVSRTNPKPDKLDYEKSSVKSNDILDFVFFDKGNLSATYYIAVYSFQYSTYNIFVRVDRGEFNLETVPLLIEGIPVRSSIHDYNGYDNFRVEIK